MNIEIKNIMSGAKDGEIVWICHYNRPDANKKPLRNIPPTKVLVRSNESLPKGKKIYYSQSHFVVLNSAGKATSKIISPVDTTGYRSYCGNTLYVFDGESECNSAWNEQLSNHIKILDGLIASSAAHWESEKKVLVAAIK